MEDVQIDYHRLFIKTARAKPTRQERKLHVRTMLAKLALAIDTKWRRQYVLPIRIKFDHTRDVFDFETDFPQVIHA
jgi:hypothetical protein